MSSTGGRSAGRLLRPVAISGCLLAAIAPVRGEPRLSAIAIQPLVDPAPLFGEAGSIDELQDGAPLVAHLVLSLVPGMDVRWRPIDPGGSGVLALAAPAALAPPPEDPPDPEDPIPPSEAIRGARQMLESLPRRWRRRSVKIYRALGLASLERREAGLLARALAERAAGNPREAASLLREFDRQDLPPIVAYLQAAVLYEAGDLQDAAGALRPQAKGQPRLPGPLASMAEAIAAAAAGDRDRALSRAEKALEKLPSLTEARLMRVSLSRTWCDLYDQDRIIADLDAAISAAPCCAACALHLAEMLAFTGRPVTAPSRIRSDAGCAGEPLDALRDRALALALTASGSLPGGLEAAARANSRDVSALRGGLAPTFLLAGDHAHLEASYDPEADLLLDGRESMELHLYAGLNDLWRGRPSRAARQFERAEEHLAPLVSEDTDSSAWMQWLRTLRIRSFLSAGRIQEARQAAEEARAAGRGRLNGVLVYTAALADLAAGDSQTALIWTRRLTLAGLKFWRYVLDAEVALADGKVSSAQSSLSLASQGIDVQTTVCPGISAEPYMMQAQARTLLALGRPGPAERLIERLIGLGPRGLFAPDVLVPALELLATAREALGSPEGAAEAYRRILELWGDGEGGPVVERARSGLERLEKARAAGHPGTMREGPEPAPPGRP